jgi:DnaJ-class molecular chaperone
MTHTSTPQTQGTKHSDQLSPHIVEIELNCDECGGSGFDPGAIDPWGPEVCPRCHGAKTEMISRNYLAEAFQIAANPDSARQIERQHLVAVIQHCRQAVSALVSLPEVA